MTSHRFEFEMVHPKSPLSNYVQAIWSAAVPSQASSVKRWLKCDAANGIVFVLGPAIYFSNTRFEANSYWFPVSRQAELIRLPPGASLAGIRFQAAAGYGVTGKLQEGVINSNQALHRQLDIAQIETALKRCDTHTSRIACLQTWLHTKLARFSQIPTSVMQTKILLDEKIPLQHVYRLLPLSQRQLERQFKKWTGMTAKEYQRIMRVKAVWESIKYNPNSDLVDLALDHGFADQAHMTREFKQIARLTPSQFCRLHADHQISRPLA